MAPTIFERIFGTNNPREIMDLRSRVKAGGSQAAQAEYEKRIAQTALQKGANTTEPRDKKDSL